MSRFQNILWWLCFLTTGLIIQLCVPGLDALIVGILLVASERDYKTMVWLIPIIVLLQEGMGSLYFGGSALSIASFFALYRIGLAIAFASNAALHFFVCLGMGALHGFYAWFFATLQNIPVLVPVLVEDGIKQALYLLIAWGLLTHLRRAHHHHEEKKKDS